ncbi:helix-turn-helix domain-containing protein [Caproicibacter sp. BJN0012]|uniref:helix-turn-helix domain-containing protein n=1 Tax=Caproicibacter sp. BJN0012 TaxID=3110227 RepID=UPI002E13701F
MDKLKKIREEAGLSQQKLAEALGLSQQSIHSYENGAYEPDISTLKMIADFFDTSVDYLIGHTEIRHKIEKLDKYDLNAQESELITKYRLLPKKLRRSLQLIVDSYL